VAARRAAFDLVADVGFVQRHQILSEGINVPGRHLGDPPMTRHVGGVDLAGCHDIGGVVRRPEVVEPELVIDGACGAPAGNDRLDDGGRAGC
jgi:hypothetical protein